MEILLPLISLVVWLENSEDITVANQLDKLHTMGGVVLCDLNVHTWTSRWELQLSAHELVCQAKSLFHSERS